MRRLIQTVCTLCALLASCLASAQTQASDAEAPKTELGLGLAVLHFPAYRGSDQASVLALPVPYIEYRGDFFKADRQGLRGDIFNSDRVELSISLSGSPPTQSDGITLRRGMPDLKPSVELGPQLNILLTPLENKAMTLKLRLPIRQGITLESKPRDAGLTFSPNLNLDISNPWGLSGGNLGFIVGPIFTSQKQNDLFYTVAPAYVTAMRPAYQSRSGYAGTQFLVSLSRKMGNVWIGSYVRYDNLRGAVFADSPLVATRNFVTAGFAVSYIFAKF